MKLNAKQLRQVIREELTQAPRRVPGDGKKPMKGLASTAKRPVKHSDMLDSDVLHRSPVGDELSVALTQLVKNHSDELYELVMKQTDDATDRPVRHEDIESFAGSAVNQALDAFHADFEAFEVLEDVAVRVLSELMEAE